MPPLYQLACDVLGIGPQQYSRYEDAASAVDESREVRVIFVAATKVGEPWEFRPSQHEIRVHPGARYEVSYFARNPTDQDMVLQAIPSLLPTQAVSYLQKVECFCFNRQPLAAGEKAEMPLIFFVDPELPQSVHTITLSYSIFDITERAGGDVALTY
jgi:cytochrome c oxidase assembly protein subunit 11